MNNKSVILISGLLLVTAVAFFIYRKSEDDKHTLAQALEKLQNLPEQE